MKILVFGAGAMGSLIGGLLSSRHEVTLVGRRGPMDAIEVHGLKVTGKTEIVARPRALTEAPRDEQDLVLIATKAYDTRTAVVQLKRFWRTSLFLTLQNGLRNADVIAEKVDRVAAGTTSHGVTFVEDGWVHHAGTGDTGIGGFKNVREREVRGLCDDFTACGFPASYSENVRRDLWMKVIVNSAINPLTAIARVENGRLLEVPQLRALLRLSCAESAAVARAEGQSISFNKALAATERVARRTAVNRSSMLQDLERGRRTEIHEISGAVVEAGRRHGISLPAIETIQLAVSVLESGFA